MRQTIKILPIFLLLFCIQKTFGQVDSTYSDTLVADTVVSDSLIADSTAFTDSTSSLQNEIVSQTEDIEPQRVEWGSGLRIVNFQGTSVLQKKRLDFCIQHRFGNLNSGAKNFYGLDESYYRLGFDYGLTNSVTLGIGRSNVGKILNGYAKWAIVKQDEQHPFSVSLFSDVNVSLAHPPTGYNPYYWTHRLKYTHQLIIAKSMLNSHLMLQIAPTIVHRNLVDSASEPNDVAILTTDMRWKINRRFSLTAEYSFIYSKDLRSQINSGAGAGLEIYTPRHVFQLLLTNAYYMNEAGVLTMQNGSIKKGNIRFGFNVVRSF